MDIGLDNFLEDMKSLPEDTISDAGESVIKVRKEMDGCVAVISLRISIIR